jgi:hypothetical protein
MFSYNASAAQLLAWCLQQGRLFLKLFRRYWAYFFWNKFNTKLIRYPIGMERFGNHYALVKSTSFLFSLPPGVPIKECLINFSFAVKLFSQLHGVLRNLNETGFEVSLEKKC